MENWLKCQISSLVKYRQTQNPNAIPGPELPLTNMQPSYINTTIQYYHHYTNLNPIKPVYNIWQSNPCTTYVNQTHVQHMAIKPVYNIWQSNPCTIYGNQTRVQYMAIKPVYNIWQSNPCTTQHMAIKPVYNIWQSNTCTIYGNQTRVQYMAIKPVYNIWQISLVTFNTCW